MLISKCGCFLTRRGRSRWLQTLPWLASPLCKKKKKNYMWHMWCVTGDTWHMTGMGRWTFSQNFSSLALTVCELFPQSTLTDWLTDWCRSNPVLAVKRSLFVEIRFLRSIFFRPHVRYMHWASNAMLDRPVASQMTKLEHIKAGK